MKTAQKILMIIGGIASIGMTFLWFIVSMIFFIGAGSAEFIEKYNDDDPEAVKAMLMVIGVIFCIMAILAVVNAIVAFKGKNTDKKGLLIMNIVFGALSGVEVNIVGAIFGLIARNRKKE